MNLWPALRMSEAIRRAERREQEHNALLAENQRYEKALEQAKGPLSRLRLDHSPACPLMHGSGTCSCGVAAIKDLEALAGDGE